MSCLEEKKGGGGQRSSLPGNAALSPPPTPTLSPSFPLSGVKAGAAEGGVTASVDAAADSAGLLELDSSTFWPFINDTAGDALVVVDFFTTWCGPCKLMMPKLAAMSAARGGRMLAVKFECNAANKEIGKELGIKSVPTFQLWKVRRGERRGGGRVGGGGGMDRNGKRERAGRLRRARARLSFFSFFLTSSLFLSLLSLPLKSTQSGEKVAVMTGAKPDELEKLIDEHL